MSTCIKWFDTHPKAKEWAWFIILWCAGLFAVVAATYPIRWLIKSIS